ncbi:hypothetical protein F4777DRAFT_91755 [Nemania sp. FL0916]|nr:hypothetical protein F4777DRAFT_91755 [Nemania sp. FL0916]
MRWRRRLRTSGNAKPTPQKLLKLGSRRESRETTRCCHPGDTSRPSRRPFATIADADWLLDGQFEMFAVTKKCQTPRHSRSTRAFWLCIMLCFNIHHAQTSYIMNYTRTQSKCFEFSVSTLRFGHGQASRFYLLPASHCIRLAKRKILDLRLDSNYSRLRSLLHPDFGRRR